MTVRPCVCVLAKSKFPYKNVLKTLIFPSFNGAGAATFMAVAFFYGIRDIQAWAVFKLGSGVVPAKLTL